MKTHGSIPEDDAPETIKILRKDMAALIDAFQSFGVDLTTGVGTFRKEDSPNAEVYEVIMPLASPIDQMVLLSRLAQGMARLQDIFEPDTETGMKACCPRHGENVLTISDGKLVRCLSCVLGASHFQDDEYVRKESLPEIYFK